MSFGLIVFSCVVFEVLNPPVASVNVDKVVHGVLFFPQASDTVSIFHTVSGEVYRRVDSIFVT